MTLAVTCVLSIKRVIRVITITIKAKVDVRGNDFVTCKLLFALQRESTNYVFNPVSSYIRMEMFAVRNNYRNAWRK